LLGDEGVEVAVEKVDERLQHMGTHAGVAPTQGVDPEQHGGPHDVFVERFAHSGCVTSNEVVLQAPRLLGLDDRVSKDSEAGCEAVHLLVLFYEEVHHLTTAAYPSDAVWMQADPSAIPCHVNDLSQREIRLTAKDQGLSSSALRSMVVGQEVWQWMVHGRAPGLA
jgi:hypothetical protein